MDCVILLLVAVGEFCRVPLFPLPLKSLAFPEKSYLAVNPEVGICDKDIVTNEFDALALDLHPLASVTVCVYVPAIAEVAPLVTTVGLRVVEAKLLGPVHIELRTPVPPDLVPVRAIVPPAQKVDCTEAVEVGNAELVTTSAASLVVAVFGAVQVLVTIQL